MGLPDVLPPHREHELWKCSSGPKIVGTGTEDPVCRCKLNLTENGVPPKWRHTRSVGQSIAGHAPGWSDPSRVNNKQLTTMEIVAEYMEYRKT
jgi:hypothetical protein